MGTSIRLPSVRWSSRREVSKERSFRHTRGGGDYAKTGWMAAGGVIFNDIGTAGLGLGVEGFYGENKHTTDAIDPGFDYGDSKTNPYGIVGIAVYNFDTGGSIMPYVFGL